MQDVIEVFAGLMAFAIVLMPVVTFVWFMRHLSKKEKLLLTEIGLSADKKESF